MYDNSIRELEGQENKERKYIIEGECGFSYASVYRWERLFL